MSVRINFVNQLPDNIIPYEDFYVKYIDNYVDLRHESWYGGYLNSLYAGFPREFPPVWHNYMCGNDWDRWHYDYYQNYLIGDTLISKVFVNYSVDNPIKKGGLKK